AYRRYLRQELARYRRQLDHRWALAQHELVVRSIHASGRQDSRVRFGDAQLRGQGVPRLPGEVRLRQPRAAAAQPREAHLIDEGAQAEYRALLPRPGERDDREALPRQEIL